MALYPAYADPEPDLDRHENEDPKNQEPNSMIQDQMLDEVTHNV
jgi:hypothetical protein